MQVSLFHEHVRQFNTTKNLYVSKSNLEEDFGINKWEKVKFWKVLFGDHSDNVKPPVPRLRKKIFQPTINEMHSQTVECFYEVLKDVNIPKATYEKLVDARDKMETNFNLVSLREDIPYDVFNYKGNKKFLDMYLRNFKCANLIPETHKIT